MFFFLFHLVLRRLVRLIAGHSAAAALEVENAVLRHQLAVLRRTVKRPELRRGDRLVLAAASGLLSREHWSVFLVSPQTLLRWQRELVRRKWTYRRRPARRPPLDPGLREYQLARLQVRYPGIPIVFADKRRQPKTGPTASSPPRSRTQPTRRDAGGRSATHDFRPLQVSADASAVIRPLVASIHDAPRTIGITACEQTPGDDWPAGRARTCGGFVGEVGEGSAHCRERLC